MKHSRGFSLVEVVLAVALLGLFVTACTGAYLYGEEATSLAGMRARATMFAEEGLEAVENMHDADFANLTAGVHGLATSSNQWVFSGTQDTNDIFTRQISITSIDANRSNVDSTVTWQETAGRTGTVTLSTRFTKWHAK